ncbi:MAG: type II toxin-antitoxin system VapC family toxin [Gammaproteobacteria bacterium]|nr:type II toxin-antitoxin system VapC family toxin [Gammaproteobacteria bacterium]MYD79398.1 type II toxin-antitoxin system VapC family toxin [Gammaproteobacteria bacterium]
MPFLLDINVESELMRKYPSPTVENWISGLRMDSSYFSTISETELRYGVAILITGRRQRTLIADTERMLEEAFPGRILPFDRVAVVSYTYIASIRRKADRPFSTVDCQIAAIGRARNLTVATRNFRDFEGMEIELVDPWLTS